MDRKEKSREKILPGIILSVLIVWGSFEASSRFYFTQQEASTETRRTKLEEMRRLNDENEKIKENAAQLEQALKAVEDRYGSLKQLVPVEAELPRVFDWVAKRALERNLKLEHFSQGSEKVEQGTISEMRLQVEVLGNYDGVERFVEDFSRFERLLCVRGVRMVQEQQQQSTYSTVRANIGFSAYVSR
jgi:Tfp pilus assembly protein PilO